jgi:hypothetical protein
VLVQWFGKELLMEEPVVDVWPELLEDEGSSIESIKTFVIRS